MRSAKNIQALLSGIVFGVGLSLSGMVNPSKILSFLDLFGGHWNPALAGVMGGAIPVAALIFRFANTRKPADQLPPPPVTKIDIKLIGGAILFGIGWGLAGLCPGPSLIAMEFDSRIIPFVVAMMIGIWAGTWVRNRVKA
jgi:hypothetical protein